MALSWATCKRLKNLAQLSLAGVAVVAADFPDNPSGLVFGAYLGLQKAQLDPSRKGMVDEVGECGWASVGGRIRGWCCVLYSFLLRAPPLQYYSYVAPCLHNRLADPTGPFSIWLLLRESVFRALIDAKHRPEDISVFGVTERDGTINHLRFPSEGMLRSQLTALVVKVFDDPNLKLTFHSMRHIFYMRA